MAGLISMLLMVLHTHAQVSNKMTDCSMERKYLVAALNRIANPVVTALGKNELKKQMPVEAAPQTILWINFLISNAGWRLHHCRQFKRSSHRFAAFM